MTYTIGEIAELFSLSTATLRFYEQEGLLPQVARNSAGRRTYGETEVNALQLIECLKTAGLQLKDIRRFMELAEQGDGTIAQRRDIIVAQQQAVAQQIKMLQETWEYLDFKRWFYDTAAAAGTVAAPEQLLAAGEKQRPGLPIAKSSAPSQQKKPA